MEGINSNCEFPFTGQKRTNKPASSAGSSSSSISTMEIQLIVDWLSMKHCGSSTRKTYHRIWKLFNQFFLRLDDKPSTWEQRLILFTGFLVNNNLIIIICHSENLHSCYQSSVDRSKCQVEQR